MGLIGDPAVEALRSASSAEQESAALKAAYSQMMYAEPKVVSDSLQRLVQRLALEFAFSPPARNTQANFHVDSPTQSPGQSPTQHYAKPIAGQRQLPEGLAAV